MIKAQLKRTGRSNNYNHDIIDTQFVNGSIKSIPKVGEGIVFHYHTLDLGTWYSTPVIKKKTTGSNVILETRNSIYQLKKGWKK